MEIKRGQRRFEVSFEDDKERVAKLLQGIECPKKCGGHLQISFSPGNGGYKVSCYNCSFTVNLEEVTLTLYRAPGSAKRERK